MSDSSHKIATGLACGVSISFTPLIGTHFIQAGVLAFLLRGNILASLIGTFAGNPWTFPVMWWLAILLGTNIFNLFGMDDFIVPVDQLRLDTLWYTLKLFGHVIGILWLQMINAILTVIPFELTPIAVNGSLSGIWGEFTNAFFRIFMPWLIGGYLLALLTWPLSYTIFFHVVRAAKRARQKAQLRRLHRIAREVTGQKK